MVEESIETTEQLSPKKVLPIKVVLPLVALVIIGAGVGGGWFFSQKEGNISSGPILPGGGSKGQEIGSADTKTFKDTAVGILEKGGIDGEGTHKLIGEGGPSQTAYLISSVIDLDQFVGQKVQLWGETFKGQKAPWLMDVGRAKRLG